ncbi:MAG: TIGR03667 family PPOX class F420-dependent oxidoreductase [Chloroflexi bacterium]|nr:TIGR03667 family PPOX class F420-dependent oxidoreductase [Chloroflexota bacterium]
MQIEINATVAQRLHDEQIIWFTTVRADGTPTPTPVWFLWANDAFLIFSQPAALKVRNIQHNPKVTLNFHTDEYGGNVVVFTGEAHVDPKPLPADELAAYLEKYAEGIKMIGMTPESMQKDFSTVIRVTPTRLRVGE